MRTFVFAIVSLACRGHGYRLVQQDLSTERLYQLTSNHGSHGSAAHADQLQSVAQKRRPILSKFLALLLLFKSSPVSGWQNPGSSPKPFGFRHQHSSQRKPLVTSDVLDSPILSRQTSLLHRAHDEQSSQDYAAPISAEAPHLRSNTELALGRRNFLATLAFATAAGTVAINPFEKAWAAEEDANQLVDDFNKLKETVGQDIDPATIDEAFDRLKDGINDDIVKLDASTSDVDFKAIVDKAVREAVAGAKAGAAASTFQTITLSWLYTALYYQYKYGGDLGSALKSLSKESDGTFLGRVSRLYQGFPFALLESPVVKLGDTAANVGLKTLLDSLPAAAGIPGPIKTAAAAATGGLWRIACQPIDTAKVTLQVGGEQGFEQLKERVKENGPALLFRGSLVAGAYTVASDYPFFLAYNALDGSFPLVSKDDVQSYLLRSALIGIVSQCLANTITNPFLVIKTAQQTAGIQAADPATQVANQSVQSVADASSDRELTIAEAFAVVTEAEGAKGLFRGLDTRLLISSIQGATFAAFLKFFETYGQ